MKPETIEKSIFWQRHVMQNTEDPVQRERCKKAIERLTEQLKQARQVAA